MALQLFERQVTGGSKPERSAMLPKIMKNQLMIVIDRGRRSI